MKEKQEAESEAVEKNMSWLKGLLNNIPLLKWVRKYSADNLLEDNELASKWSVETSEETISVGDKTLTKLLVTNARFAGEEHSRYNIKHVAEVVKELGSEGELIVGKNDKHELFIQIGTNVVVICPLPKQDKKEN